ncbi:MAG: nucleoid-associated protein YgaU [Saprospiraceae bacterium]|jgi:nucleoid-associated protein YgaU
MGLFSFLKNAGAKLMGRSAETNETEAAASAAKRADMLRSIIASSGVGIENLDVELDNDKVTVYGQTESVEDKEKIVLIAGNVEGIATVDDRISVVAPVQSRFHEVKSGDTLSKISKEVYGDPMKYNVIFEANKPMLSHPDKIYPGQMLRIPNL